MEENQPLKFSDIKYQYLAVYCINIITLCHGSAIGWLSPSLAILQSEDSPLHTGPVNTSEVSWIGSYFSIGSIIGNVIFGVSIKFLGLKKTIFLLPLPNIGFWLSVLLGSETFHLYIGRTLAGMSGGGIYVCVPLFVSEIADRKIRGALGSLLMVICSIGILSAFVASSYLNYGTVPYVFMFLPLIFMVGFFILPETPHSLLARNNFKGAEESFIFYRRGNNLNGRQTKDITAELENLQMVLKARDVEKQNSNVLQDLCTWPAIKGILIGFGLTGLSLFSGTFAMINYTGTIFKESGSNIDPNISSIIVATIQVFGVYLSTMLVDRVGRKTLLIISSAGAAIALAVLGTFSFLHEQDVDLIHFNWVPLVSFSFYVFITCIGVMPLPFVILAEILPPKIRDIGSTICMGSISVFAFTSLKLFPILIDNFGLYVAMWICCGVCVFGVAFSIFILKETKGKNLNTLDEK